MRLISTQGRGAKQAAILIAQLERRGSTSFDSVQSAVEKILLDIRKQGDKALFRYARRFDNLAKTASIQVTQEETAAAWQQLDPALQKALEKAAKNIRAFAQQQLPNSWQSTPSKGLATGQLVRPIESVGCYVPGGRHPLPSTMLMTAIPAQVAGVPRIAVTSPNPALETLATAHLLGIHEFYRIGGAHAIAALAYGTDSIPHVTKIVGPGNLYVTAAKRAIAFDCAIDMLAGPTEIVVTSDLGIPANVASDLVAQAEHDLEALAIFITTNEPLASAVIYEVKQRTRNNPIAKEALKRNGYVILVANKEEAHAITNRLAPEHLTVDTEDDLQWVQNAGSIFIGPHSPQPMGDYISGPNHTLPTGGMAKVRGGLSVNDFLKLITIQQYTAQGLSQLGPHAMRIAEAEGLTAHAEAIQTRLKSPE
jgi:histidinol dehydrogenase